uniref:RxLR effector protein BLR31 n=1 Tax=Bremia lactucae TaxID=4779 RepID=BLR31_BRELC|nr:RecName: Full=RxLR effector protein BLR31; Flags: Precursor [Bremia lactucae]ASZ00240.1 BLR31 [Bremia lactucae]
MLLSRAISVLALLACIRCGVHAQNTEQNLKTQLTTDSAMITSQRLLRTSVDFKDSEERWPTESSRIRSAIKDYFREFPEKVSIAMAIRQIDAHGVRHVEKVLSQYKFPAADQGNIRLAIIHHKAPK